MSRRGNCYDNAMAENFFGILKTECIYRHKPETFEQANKMIDDYIYFYNHERIQLKTGLAPLTLRQSLLSSPLHEGSFYSCLLILGQFNSPHIRRFLFLISAAVGLAVLSYLSVGIFFCPPHETRKDMERQGLMKNFAKSVIE